MNLLSAPFSVTELARAGGLCRSVVYDEIERGCLAATRRPGGGSWGHDHAYVIEPAEASRWLAAYRTDKSHPRPATHAASEPTAAINLQWKGTDACYDYWCPCGWQGPENGDEDEPTNHEDGYFKQQFRCGGCGQWWHLPNRVIARPGKFFRDEGGYGCNDCENGHTR